MTGNPTSTMTLAAMIGALAVLAAPTAARAQAAAGADTQAQMRVGARGLIVTPGSGRHGIAGRAHTNHHIFVPFGAPMSVPAPYDSFETPASLACVYGLTPAVAGCNPQLVATPASAGSRTIAIVDAYDDPTAAADLAVFSARYGLPAPTAQNFQVVYANGVKPAPDPTGGWAIETALDIEVAHALAPGARIMLVEAASPGLDDLLAAEWLAVQEVALTGGEVSNSWGTDEFDAESNYQPWFAAPGAVVFAAAGDAPGAEFPAALPNVIGVGGTTINRDSAGNYLGQSTWNRDGGGVSAVMPLPFFQAGVIATVGTARGTPDVALDANPGSGVWVFDSTPYNGVVPEWLIVGGTSLATPAMAAIVNDAGAFRASTVAEQVAFYGGAYTGGNFIDVPAGVCANAASGMATPGYDLCTGIGTPYGIGGK